MARLLDALVFSSLWVAAAAAALAAAASLAMGAAPPAAAVGLAFCGTLVVYTIDRLRDLERDRHTTPQRSRFVSRHRGALGALSAVAVLLAAPLAWAAGAPAIALLAPVALAGFFHRRLKRFAAWKALYVSAAWVAVCVGLPAVLAPAPRHVAWVAAPLSLAILANAIASNVRDDEAATARLGVAVPLRIARGVAVLASAVGVLAPQPVRPIAAVPLWTLVALLGFRRDERYGLFAVDGALLLGGLTAIALLGSSPPG